MNIVVIGAQWGDEGKGKVVDYLASQADVVVRFSGGANAGHRITIDKKQYDFHLLPSGLLNSQTLVILGTAMVIDLEALFQEIDLFENQKVSISNRILISDRAHIVLPRYLELDRIHDMNRPFPLGTTGKGIGVAYSLKAQRIGIRIADLFSDQFFSKLAQKEQEYLKPYLFRLKNMSIDLPHYMEQIQGKKIIFEGAQGVMLDLDLGSYPYVTSSNTALAGALIGGNVPAHAINHVLGVFKAYSTRVGNGPFPSEFSAKQKDLEEKIRTIGHEFGVTTGRERRCGYLDLLALKYACWNTGIQSLAITHLDVYDSFNEIGVCVSYEHEGKVIDWVPASSDVLEKLTPVIKKFPGWKTNTGVITRWEELPRRAREYLNFIEKYVGIPLSIISVGAEREQIIYKQEVW